MAIAEVLRRKSIHARVDPEAAARPVARAVPVAENGDADDLLVRQHLAGDAQAFDRLVLAYRSRVYALARLALGEAEEAHDVTQETFVRAYEALPQYRQQGRFRTWIYTICSNLCRNRLKARRSVLSWEEIEPAQEPIDPAPSPEDRALVRERALAVRAAIAQMSERDRLVVILYYQDDTPVQEIARVLGCRAGAVKMALHRARIRLRERLESSGLM